MTQRNQQSEQLLKEVYKATKTGLEAIQTVLPKVKNSELRAEIEHQGTAYKSFAAKSEKLLTQSGALTEEITPLQKVSMWGSIQMNTLADASPEHITEMMINGTTLGIVDITKALNNAPEADRGARRLADDYVNCEQQHIDNLKTML